MRHRVRYTTTAIMAINWIELNTATVGGGGAQCVHAVRSAIWSASRRDREKFKLDATHGEQRRRCKSNGGCKRNENRNTNKNVETNLCNTKSGRIEMTRWPMQPNAAAQQRSLIRSTREYSPRAFLYQYWIFNPISNAYLMEGKNHFPYSLSSQFMKLHIVSL